MQTYAHVLPEVQKQVAAWECPGSSVISRGLTPCVNRSVAALCRRSGKRIAGSAGFGGSIPFFGFGLVEVMCGARRTDNNANIHVQLQQIGYGKPTGKLSVLPFTPSIVTVTS
jgi:hypothetical protein